MSSHFGWLKLRGVFVALVLSLIYTSGTAQESDLSDPELTARIDSIITEMTFQYITTNPEEAEPILLEAKALSDSIGYKRGQAMALANLSTLYNYLSKFDVSVESHLQAIRLLEEIDDMEEVGFQYSELGYRMRRRDMDRGEYFMRTGIRILKEFEEGIPIANAYNNYGMLKLEKKETDSARIFIQRSLDIKKAENDTLGMAYSYGYLGGIEMQLGNYERAIQYTEQGYDMRRVLGDTSGMAIDLHNIGFAHLELGNFDDAIFYYKTSLKLATKIKYHRLAEFNYGTIAETFEGAGKLDSALFYQREYSAYHDARIDEAANNRVAELEVQFETEQKEKELAQRNVQLAEERLKVDRRNWILAALGGLFAFGLFITGLVIRQQKIKQENLKRENELKIQLTNAEMENKIHQERERISRDLHDNVGAHITNLITGLEISNLHLQKDQKESAIDLLGDLDSDARNAMNELRETIWLLDKDEVTLSTFIEHVKAYLKRQERYLGTMKTSVSSSVSGQLIINPIQSLNLIRIIQESLNNSKKYSQAELYEISFTNTDEGINITLNDNGVGMDLDVRPSFGNGLRNMQSRAEEIGGEFRIKSSPDKGTEISIGIPL